ncbi:hypothetical protein [Streptomyces sp. NPDC059349]|uniref:hypothetical protein n=1 Tax=Streptomyces sp. NPDC059349 TaxID=3346808 RepID=UPI0036B3590B
MSAQLTDDNARAIAANPAQSVADTASRFLREFSAASRGYQLDDDNRQLVDDMSSAVSTAMSLASQASRKSAAILADETLYPEGRNRLASEATEEARRKVAEAFDVFDTNYTIAEATLYETARPKVDRHSQAAARQDAMMLLDGMLNGEGASTSRVLQRLAGRQDAVGALVASEWLQDYGMARGMSQGVLEASQTLIRQAALEGAADSGDPERVAAARTALALPSLRQAQVSARTFVGLALR